MQPCRQAASHMGLPYTLPTHPCRSPFLTPSSSHPDVSAFCAPLGPVSYPTLALLSAPFLGCLLSCSLCLWRFCLRARGPCLPVGHGVSPVPRTLATAPPSSKRTR